jgi:hypothetical protein
VQGQDKVGVRVLYYRDQTDKSKLVSSINNLVVPGGKSEWAVVSTAAALAYRLRRVPCHCGQRIFVAAEGLQLQRPS